MWNIFWLKRLAIGIWQIKLLVQESRNVLVKYSSFVLIESLWALLHVVNCYKFVYLIPFVFHLSFSILSDF